MPRSGVRGSQSRLFRQGSLGTHPGFSLLTPSRPARRCSAPAAIADGRRACAPRDPGTEPTAAERCAHVSRSPRSGRAPTGGLGPRREAPPTPFSKAAGPDRSPNPPPSSAPHSSTGCRRLHWAGPEAGRGWGGRGRWRGGACFMLQPKERGLALKEQF